MNATTYTASQIAQIIAEMSANYTDRKVTADDVAQGASRETTVAVANDILANYTGTFQYMLNMTKYVNFGLTDAQIAGVLNCAIADYRYSQRKAAVQVAEQVISTTPATTQVVPDGWYTIVGPQGGHRTLRITTVDTVDAKGNATSDGVKQWVAYLSGPDNGSDYTTVAFLNGATVSLFKKNEGKYSDIVAATRFLVRNVAKLDEMGRQYAIRSGKCYRCNRRLTTPESVARGLGPICESK